MISKYLVFIGVLGSLVMFNYMLYINLIISDNISENQKGLFLTSTFLTEFFININFFFFTYIFIGAIISLISCRMCLNKGTKEIQVPFGYSRLMNSISLQTTFTFIWLNLLTILTGGLFALWISNSHRKRIFAIILSILLSSQLIFVIFLLSKEVKLDYFMIFEALFPIIFTSASIYIDTLLKFRGDLWGRKFSYFTLVFLSFLTLLGMFVTEKKHTAYENIFSGVLVVESASVLDYLTGDRLSKTGFLYGSSVKEWGLNIVKDKKAYDEYQRTKEYYY